MKKSKNAEVQKFLEDMMLFDVTKHAILQKSRQLVFKHCAKTDERMMYGGIMFSRGADFGGVFASKKHVSFEFGNGYLLNDPDAILEGSGKFRRHIKIKKLRDVEDKKLTFYIKQAIEKTIYENNNSKSNK